MTPKEEAAYQEGKRAVWRQLLGRCALELGVSDPLGKVAGYLAERADAMQALRLLCVLVGDTDWDDTLALSDIIDKHVLPYVESALKPAKKK